MPTSEAAPTPGLRILFVVTEDFYFATHRLLFAARLVEAGHCVAVACRCVDHADMISAAGVLVYPVDIARQTVSATRALQEARHIARVVKQYAPDIVHAVAIRPILLVWLAKVLSRLRVPTVNAITGLGSLFTGELKSPVMRLTRMAVAASFRLAFNHRNTYSVFQNSDDLEDFVRRGICRRGKTVLIRGAGVDIISDPMAEPDNAPPIVIYLGRFLRDKGVGELIAASQALTTRGILHHLVMIGWIDECNPNSFRARDVDAWGKHSQITVVPKQADVTLQISNSNIVAVPSYREGLPKVILEAGLAQRAVVTTDVPGCREIIKHEVNGLLVPARDSVRLAEAIARLLTNSDLRRRLAQRLRQDVESEFSLDYVSAEFLKLYQMIASDAQAGIQLEDVNH